MLTKNISSNFGRVCVWAADGEETRGPLKTRPRAASLTSASREPILLRPTAAGGGDEEVEGGEELFRDPAEERVSQTDDAFRDGDGNMSQKAEDGSERGGSQQHLG